MGSGMEMMEYMTTGLTCSTKAYFLVCRVAAWIEFCLCCTKCSSTGIGEVRWPGTFETRVSAVVGASAYKGSRTSDGTLPFRILLEPVAVGIS